MTPEQKKALDDYLASTQGFVDRGQKEYEVTGNLAPEDLGSSAMGQIQTDPTYKQHEIAALKELERQSQEGFTARDRADMARVETSANRAHQGRVGAIQDNMRQRGMSGSGMEMVAQMQSAQDANELAAMKALEQEGAMQDRKSSATMQLGGMAGNMQQRDFNQAAAKAEAADRIAQFNNQNRNSAQQYNLANRQNVANMNIGGANAFSGAAMGAQQQGAQMAYNAATEEENQRRLAKQQAAARKAAQAKAVGSTVGMVAGGVLGTFAAPGVGTAAGASMGSQLGGGLGTAATGYAHGGVVPGEAKVAGDSPDNDTVPAMLSPGEVVLPRSVVQDGHLDAISDLLRAVERLRGDKKGK